MITRIGQDYEEMGPAPTAIMTSKIEQKSPALVKAEKAAAFLARAAAVGYPPAEAQRITARYMGATESFDEAAHLDQFVDNLNAWMLEAWKIWTGPLDQASKNGWKDTIRAWLLKWKAPNIPAFWEGKLNSLDYSPLFMFTSLFYPESYWRAHEINAARNITQYITEAPIWIRDTAEGGREELRKKVLETLAKVKPNWKNEVDPALIPPFMEAYEADKLTELANLEMTVQQEKTAKVIGIGLVAAFGVFFATKILRKKATK